MRQLPKLTIFLICSMFLPAVVNAALISTSYQVNLNNSDSGLVVNASDVAENPLSFDLNPGESEVFTLFNIWTNEGAVNSDDGGPIELVFGALGDGLLRITLLDTEFNEGAFWGRGSLGADVTGQIELISEASAVPEPGTLALLALALVGLAIHSRRRKSSNRD